ncbi:unnamed protein product [Miscanthus lutarioriparius]|uniref:WRKY domain-containing protein n=1 Tax=Miscanthus lutarioriparius TaxID=422564 RepID=A0A811SD92_9POAL|nr:unnamed protein product [Miscanthus lutarioriparius]
MAADDPWSSRAEHYRARRGGCSARSGRRRPSPGPSRPPRRGRRGHRPLRLAAVGGRELRRDDDGRDGGAGAPEHVQEKNNRVCSGGYIIALGFNMITESWKQRKGLPRWTAKLRVPDASLEATPDDGFSWRKYGQKHILGAKFPRGYYRCTYRTAQACAATKQVQRSDTDLCVFDVTYQGEHTCHQKQRATVAAAAAAHGGSQSPPPEPLEQQQDPSMQLLGMGFKRVLKVETAGLHDHDRDRDRGPASAPAASFSFSFPSMPPFHHPGDATTDNNPAAAAAAAAAPFSLPASSYFPAPQHPVVVDGSCYDVVYDYEAPGARIHGAESSELGEVVTRAITAPAAFDYSSLFHHQAELDDPHLPFPPFGGPPHGPYQ